MKKNIYFFNIAAAFILTAAMMTGCKPQIASEQSTHKENLPSFSYTKVKFTELEEHLKSIAADGVYYIEVTGLTNTDLESSSWATPSPLGKILKDCGKKVALKLSGAMTVIGKSAFYGCTELTSIIMPYGITEISWAAFLNCTGLTEIHLPASLNEIDENPFSRCIHHTKLTVDAGNLKYKSENNMVYTSDMKTLVCAAGGLTNITIPNSVTAISECAFYKCLNLSNITIKSTGLTDITPETFKWIKDHARFTVKTEAVKTLLHTQGYIAEDKITVNPSL